MVFLRSLAFNTIFFLWTFLVAFVGSVVLWCLPREVLVGWLAFWAQSVLFLLRAITNIRLEVRGQECFSGKGPVVIACKHQSAWDTFIFHVLAEDPAYIMKNALFHIPFYGWSARLVGMIGVDRDGGRRSLRQVLRKARRALEDGRTVIIFPEGTRTKPGTNKEYLPGTFALYKHVAGSAPVIPAALDSGYSWGRRTFLRRPGTITIQLLPAIPVGLTYQEFQSTLKERIETACQLLAREKNHD